MSDNDIELPGVLASPDELRAAATGDTFILTAAQSNTKLHDGFWQALLSCAKDKGAELHVSRFMYNKNSLNTQGEKPGEDGADDGVWFDPRIEPFVSDESLQLAPDLVWCGELNIIPTRVNPISGFQNYTRAASCIIPHAKMALESVANMKNDAAKQVLTTGAVTLRNYIQKAAGQKAEFHHVFGAIIVEVDEDGTWWARQINCSPDGSFYDLDRLYRPDGNINYGLRAQAITHGDIHGVKMDYGIMTAVFGQGGILDVLRPREQFFHDIIDFMPRNHHNLKDGHFLYRTNRDGLGSVEAEFDLVAEWLTRDATKTTPGLYRPWCKSFVVVSNHDQAIEQWLRNPAAMTDPENLLFWHQINAMVLASDDPHPFEQTLRRSEQKDRGRGRPRDCFTVLREDDSYRILGEIEAALHGHLGTNGARGSARNLRGAGKVNSGHTHSPTIMDGVYIAGIYGEFDMGYNKGLSSWAQAFTLTYPNAKRAICTIKKGKAWR